MSVKLQYLLREGQDVPKVGDEVLADYSLAGVKANLNLVEGSSLDELLRKLGTDILPNTQFDHPRIARIIYDNGLEIKAERRETRTENGIFTYELRVLEVNGKPLKSGTVTLTQGYKAEKKLVDPKEKFAAAAEEIKKISKSFGVEVCDKKWPIAYGKFISGELGNGKGKAPYVAGKIKITQVY